MRLAGNGTDFVLAALCKIRSCVRKYRAQKHHAGRHAQSIREFIAEIQGR